MVPEGSKSTVRPLPITGGGRAVRFALALTAAVAAAACLIFPYSAAVPGTTQRLPGVPAWSARVEGFDHQPAGTVGGAGEAGSAGAAGAVVAVGAVGSVGAAGAAASTRRVPVAASLPRNDFRPDDNKNPGRIAPPPPGAAGTGTGSAGAGAGAAGGWDGVAAVASSPFADQPELLHPRRRRRDKRLGRGGSGRVLQDVELELSKGEDSKEEQSAWEGDGAARDGSGGGAEIVFGSAGGLAEFPSVEESTVMFLHVFKCAGSTTRRMLVDWAEEDGQHGAIVHRCNYLKEGEICLRAYQLIDEEAQRTQISKLKVLAGHFLWGFQRHVEGPHLLVTALRNPLEVFVSAKQYIHRKETKTLEKAGQFVSSEMWKALRKAGNATGSAGDDGDNQQQQYGQIGGFIRRFVGAGQRTLFGEDLVTATAEGLRNLETFWIVGVVEQFAGFQEVLKRSLDPGRKHQGLWDKYSEKKYNKSPVGSRDVLAAIEPDLIDVFNRSLALQWEIYESAVGLWDARCREVLPPEVHQDLCNVPPPAESYGYR